MTDMLSPGTGLIFMKVGIHANESLDDIIKRKRDEIDQAGYALWGYGGNTCHPLTMVQPFARDFERRNGAIYLVMQKMNSRHFAAPVRAQQQSRDGVEWEDIPEAINVLGSRFALAIKDLKVEEFELPLNRTEVAVGRSKGRRGDNYIKGQADKGCLVVLDDEHPLEIPEPKTIHIGLTAELADPYAVFVR